MINFTEVFLNNNLQQLKQAVIFWKMSQYFLKTQISQQHSSSDTGSSRYSLKRIFQKMAKTPLTLENIFILRKCPLISSNVLFLAPTFFVVTFGILSYISEFFQISFSFFLFFRISITKFNHTSNPTIIWPVKQVFL